MLNLEVSLDELTALSEGNRVVPIFTRIPTSGLSPLEIYSCLAESRDGTFLLESAQQGIWSRYSFVGAGVRGMLAMQQGGQLTWRSETHASVFPEADRVLPADPFTALSELQKAWSSPQNTSLPILTSGLVGFMGWDLIRNIERMSSEIKPSGGAPTMAMTMIQDLAIIDHLKNELFLVSNVYVVDDADLLKEYESAVQRIEHMNAKLSAFEAGPIVDLNLDSQIVYRTLLSKQDFVNGVEVAKKHVRKGDVFQVVLSQRLETDCPATPVQVYEALRHVNPSPYMYLFNFKDGTEPYAVVGSSPEALVTIVGNQATTHPIAGSRPRGSTEAQDLLLESELIADVKEKAEHLMLVDLSRNDLLKVCDPDSVEVTEFMEIHRYSHVMHLVSTVVGTLRDGIDAIDAFRATFPAGTLSGAPKPRALEIIEELEPFNRGIFGGVVGYFDFKGNADLAITIRTAFIRNGIASVQAGAGIVLDSDSESEYQETIAKASAPLRAIAIANASIQ